MDYTTDFKINKYKLDDEWERQPSLMQGCTQLLADAIKQKDVVDANLELKKAEKEKAIRDNPSAYGLEKATDKAVTSVVTIDKEVRELQSQFINATYEANVLKGAVNSLEHKKASLEWMSRLFLKSYFSTPSTFDQKEDVDFDRNVFDKTQHEELNKNLRIRRRVGS